MFRLKKSKSTRKSKQNTEPTKNAAVTPPPKAVVQQHHKRPSSLNASLDRYDISKELIGEGAFGKVKLAKDLHNSKKEVAIKLTLVEDLKRQSLEQNMKNEIANLELCIHSPHVMELYNVIYSPTCIYIVTEYCPQGDLFEYMIHQHGSLPIEESKRLFQQVCQGVEFLHDKRIIHRDLTLENILLDATHSIKIADFGLSKRVDSLSEYMYTGCGSPNYYAPEMLLEGKYLGPKIDMWACGVVVYALLCGYMPFEDPDNSKLYELIKAQQFEYPDSLGSPERVFISTLLEPMVSKRKSAKEIQQHEWFKTNTTGGKDGNDAVKKPTSTPSVPKKKSSWKLPKKKSTGATTPSSGSQSDAQNPKKKDSTKKKRGKSRLFFLGRRDLFSRLDYKK